MNPFQEESMELLNKSGIEMDQLKRFAFPANLAPLDKIKNGGCFGAAEQRMKS